MLTNTHSAHPVPGPAISLFSNSQQVLIDKSQINVSSTTVIEDRSKKDALDLLKSHCALNALVDANERFDAPRCAEETRVAIIQQIIEWIFAEQDVPSILWLLGGAGAGKSALQQTVAELLQRENNLAASFFFSRTASGRNDGNLLIPTLVFQLLQTFPEIQPFVLERIIKDSGIFSKSRRTQMEKLFVEPLNYALANDPDSRYKPRLVVIDGLDECSDPDVQSDLLRIIADATSLLSFPFRFVIASRPEAHIHRVFETYRTLQTFPPLRLDLSQVREANADIARFLRQGFQKIRREHPCKAALDHKWPNDRVVDILVERSSGHFIYASVTMAYVGSPKHHPDDRLRVILGLSPSPTNDSPFAQLDEVYTLVFSGIDDKDLNTTLCFFGLLHIERNHLLGIDLPQLTQEVMDDFLQLRPGDLDLLLDPLRSLVFLRDEDPTARNDFRVRHASVYDFLLDPSRAGRFTLDLGLSHEALAKYVMRLWIKNVPHNDNGHYRSSMRERFSSFVLHCQHAHFSDSVLKDYLASFKVLYDTILVDLHNHGVRLPSIHTFFQILLREDVDKTGKLHAFHTSKVAQAFDLYRKSVVIQTDTSGSWLGWMLGNRSIPFYGTSVNIDDERQFGDRQVADYIIGLDLADDGLEFKFSRESMSKDKQVLMKTITLVLSKWQPAISEEDIIALRNRKFKTRDLIFQKERDAIAGVLIWDRYAVVKATPLRYLTVTQGVLLHACYYVITPRSLLLVILTYLPDGRSLCTHILHRQIYAQLVGHLKEVQQKLTALVKTMPKPK